MSFPHPRGVTQLLIFALQPVHVLCDGGRVEERQQSFPFLHHGTQGRVTGQQRLLQHLNMRHINHALQLIRVIMNHKHIHNHDIMHVCNIRHTVITRYIKAFR